MVLHQGLRLDAATRTYANRLREDDPAQGRFLQADPAGYVDGPRRYQYEVGDPVDDADPSGLDVAVMPTAPAPSAMPSPTMTPGSSPSSLAPGGSGCPVQAGLTLIQAGPEIDSFFYSHLGWYRSAADWANDKKNDLDHYVRKLPSRAKEYVGKKMLFMSRAQAYRLEPSGERYVTPCPKTSAGGNGQKPPAPPSVSGPSTRPANDHHIATNKNTKAGNQWTNKFQPMFDKAGIGMNDRANRVMVDDHVGPHRPEYHQMIYDRLQAATDGLNGGAYKQAFLDELEELGVEITTPGTELNRLVTTR